MGKMIVAMIGEFPGTIKSGASMGALRLTLNIAAKQYTCFNFSIPVGYERKYTKC
jgi:hypothetical protein